MKAGDALMVVLSDTKPDDQVVRRKPMRSTFVRRRESPRWFVVKVDGTNYEWDCRDSDQVEPNNTRHIGNWWPL